MEVKRMSATEKEWYCKLHSVKDNKCSNVTWADRHTPDNGFCYEAEPMTAKEAKRARDDYS